MQRSSRRQFFGQALAAGAGATLVRPFATATAATPATSPPIDHPDPNFIIGPVVNVTSDGTLSVVSPDDELRIARLTAASAVWKAAQWNAFDIDPGDCVMGRGELAADGALLIDRIWANILNLRGRIESVDTPAKQVRLRGSDGALADVAVTDATLTLDSQGHQGHGDPAAVKPGEPAMIIAYRDPASGRLTAHRLESLLSAGASAVSPEPAPMPTAPGVQPNITVARRGNATYFCCGHAGCACGTGGPGYCSGCRSDYWQIAWPLVSSCTAPCYSCCLEPDFPRFGCGTQFYASNPCQPGLGWIQVAIADCGPNPYCRSTGCMSYDSVRFDLTSCAFSALGGSYELGHMNLHVSPPL